MNIGIECKQLFRTNKHGIDMVALELIRHLQQVDCENQYYIFVSPDEDCECLTETSNFKIVEIASSSTMYWIHVLLPKFAEFYKCDILHCTGNLTPTKGNIPILLTLHDVFPFENSALDSEIAKNYWKLNNIYFRWNVRKAIKKASKILTVSQSETERIKKIADLPENKLGYLHNGIAERFKLINNYQELRLIKERFELPKHFIMFLGTLEPKKNISRVLKAYSILRIKYNQNIQLVMPDIGEYELDKILKSIDAVELRKYINIIGYIPNYYLPAVYNLCDVFLYPSLHESFGIPILEAMACGAPVVTSNITSMPEIAGNAALLVNPYAPEEIAEAIHRLLTNQTLREHCIEQGLARVKQFSWMNIAKEMKGIYETMIK